MLNKLIDMLKRKEYKPTLPIFGWGKKKMESSVLRAILNIASFGDNNLKRYASTYLNRVNAVGEQLEFYIKDAIASSFELPQDKKQEAYSKCFSWLGNQNHPPDIIIKESDAFEIKKIEGLKSSLALNSSPPKNKLRVDDGRLTADCKKCDGGKWKEKDLFYVIGSAKGGIVNYLFFVQGTCYAADHEVYEKRKKIIKNKLKAIESKNSFHFNLNYGKVKNPMAVFSKFISIKSKKFNVFAILEKQKYYSFPQKDRFLLESSHKLKLSDIIVKSPNDMTQSIAAKLISYAK